MPRQTEFEPCKDESSEEMIGAFWDSVLVLGVLPVNSVRQLCELVNSHRERPTVGRHLSSVLQYRRLRKTALRWMGSPRTK